MSEPRTARITLRVTPQRLATIDSLVASDRYATRSAVLRAALDGLLTREARLIGGAPRGEHTRPHRPDDDDGSLSTSVDGTAVADAVVAHHSREGSR